jgi:hypothetical protein
MEWPSEAIPSITAEGDRATFFPFRASVHGVARWGYTEWMVFFQGFPLVTSGYGRVAHSGRFAAGDSVLWGRAS